MLNLSSENFARAIPTNKEPDLWKGYASEYFERYEINNNDRIAGFLSQTAHESSDFTRYIESTNYSWDRLVAVFGRRYFPSDSFAKTFHRDSKKIANYVYDDRNPARKNKLGNTKDGDGWNFRGSGLIQLTGRWNITNFGNDVDMTPEDAAAYCRTKRGAMHSACWFWWKNNINRIADSRNVDTMTKAVNGGEIGIADRRRRWNLLKDLNFIAGEYPSLSKGSRGEIVKKVQSGLGFKGKDVDGIFGNQTLAAVRNWQKAVGVSVTGVLTPNQVKQIIGE